MTPTPADWKAATKVRLSQAAVLPARVRRVVAAGVLRVGELRGLLHGGWQGCCYTSILGAGKGRPVPHSPCRLAPIANTWQHTLQLAAGVDTSLPQGSSPPRLLCV